MSSKSASKRRKVRKAAATPKSIRPLATHVKLYNAALDEDPETKDIILRGRLDVNTLEAIMVDDYQREVLAQKEIDKVLKGFQAGGGVPDLDLGMRGEKFKETGNEFVLLSNVYVVDGLQRMTAAIQYRDSGKTPNIGATVHFNTTEPWERERFRILNSMRSKVSPNVLIRNKQTELAVIDLLLRLCQNDNSFVFKGKVCWQQNKLRQHLISARSLVITLLNLHSHLVGLTTVVDPMVDNLQVACDKVGRNTFRDNVKEFGRILEVCWGVSTVSYVGAANHLKNTFLMSLARLLSNHEVFWKDNTRLFVDARILQKLKLFPTQDPSIAQLSSSGGKGAGMLYHLMIDHINSGKRTKRLVPRISEDKIADDISQEGDE